MMNQELKQYKQAISQQRTEKRIKRRFSLESDFMDYRTDDVLYGIMRSLSTARKVYTNGTETYQEYLPIKTFKKHRKMIANICDCSTRTLDRHIEDLFNRGLLDQGIEEVSKYDSKGKLLKTYDIDVYWFPFDYHGKYQIIDRDIIEHLIYTRSKQAIKIFVYLANKYDWKKDYEFTLAELSQALRYSSSTDSCNSLIKHCLASFKAEGLIDYDIVAVQKEVESVSDYKVITVYHMRLKYVCQTADDLPKFN